MAEPDDLILPLLREMRAQIAAESGENAKRHSQIIARLDKLEDQQRSFRHALTADTLMSKLLTGEFEERIEALEKKVRELESQK
jgi:polyhydroxyalkanoate synthesis regulator phasin